MQSQPDGIFKIKVLRITPPKLYSSYLKGLNLPFSTNSEPKSLESQYTPFYLQNNYFQLNTDFGKVYVGEALKVIVSITNISNLPAESANIQAELYTDTKSTQNKEPVQKDYLKTMTLFNVKPHDPIIFPLEFRLEDQDTYHLGFRIAYKHEYIVGGSPNNVQIAERIQEKKFKFDARLPFSLNYRIFQGEDKHRVFLEIKIDQQTKQIIFFKNVKFNPSGAYELIENDKDKLHMNKDKISINPGENFKIIYQLKFKNTKKPTVPNSVNSFISTVDMLNLGQLFFEWFNIINEAGSMYSKVISMNQPEYDLTFKFVDLPKLLYKEILSSQDALLTNNTDKEMDIIFNLNEKDMVGVKIIGLSRYDLKIPPKKSETIVLFILPVFLGIQKFSGLRIFNRLTQKEVSFNNLNDTYIVDHIDEESDVQSSKEIHLSKSNQADQIIDLLSA